MGGFSCHLSAQNGVEKDILIAQPGLDYVSVSYQGSRTSGPPRLGAKLERGALGGKALEVPTERCCQEVSGRGSLTPSLDLNICQGCSGFKQPHTPRRASLNSLDERLKGGKEGRNGMSSWEGQMECLRRMGTEDIWGDGAFPGP